MADSKKIGSRIKLRREELGLTLEQLASKLRLNKSTIQRYETGQVQNIKLPILQSMAEQLNVDPNWLACISDKKSGFDELQKENNPEKPELAENMIVYHRDGKTSEVKLSPKKMDLLIQMIEEFKENNNPDL